MQGQWDEGMQLVTYVSLLVELVVPSAQANFLPAKNGDGSFDLIGIKVNGNQYPVPGPGQPNFRVNLNKSCDVSHPCCAVIGVIARDGDFFGDPIPDVCEQTLYYRWEVDGKVPENYSSNYVSCFQYCRGNGLLNKAKYWTYGDHTLTCYVRDPRPGEQGYLPICRRLAYCLARRHRLGQQIGYHSQNLRAVLFLGVCEAHSREDRGWEFTCAIQCEDTMHQA